MFVIKNLTQAPLPIDGVDIDPGQQLDVQLLSPDMIAARDRGDLQVRSGDTTLEERKADVEAFRMSDFAAGKE